MATAIAWVVRVRGRLFLPASSCYRSTSAAFAVLGGQSGASTAEPTRPGRQTKLLMACDRDDGFTVRFAASPFAAACGCLSRPCLCLCVLTDLACRFHTSPSAPLHLDGTGFAAQYSCVLPSCQATVTGEQGRYVCVVREKRRVKMVAVGAGQGVEVLRGRAEGRRWRM